MTTFNPADFAAREQRRIERLTRARAVGATHGWFRRSTVEQQAEKVAEWVEDALYAREVRLGLVPDIWPRQSN